MPAGYFFITASQVMSWIRLFGEIMGLREFPAR
jgi:hypothetical protein